MLVQGMGGVLTGCIVEVTPNAQELSSKKIQRSCHLLSCVCVCVCVSVCLCVCVLLDVCLPKRQEAVLSIGRNRLWLDQ